MKKHLSIAAVFLLAAALAIAHAPTVSIDPIGPLEFATFPQVVDVTGTVAHSDPGNINSVNDLTLFINGVQEGAVIDPFEDLGNVGSAPFTLPWTIMGPGTYTLMVSASHGNGDGNATTDVTVSEIIIVVEECPAAPAIAGEYLKSEGVKSGSKIWKSVMTAVAGETGSNGTLWAANACDPGYADAVIAYVDALLA